jgi:hypothetical protein
MSLTHGLQDVHNIPPRLTLFTGGSLFRGDWEKRFKVGSGLPSVQAVKFTLSSGCFEGLDLGPMNPPFSRVGSGYEACPVSLRW